MNSSTLAAADSSTKLCAMAILGIVPTDFRTMCRVSPGFASIVVMLNFMSSLAVSSTVRAPLAAAAAAGLAVAGGWVAAGFGAVACGPGMSARERDKTHSNCMSLILKEKEIR